MATVTVEVTIEGTRPLLWHHFGPDAIPLEAKPRTGKAGNDPDEWKKTVLATEDGQLYVEASYVFACLRAGAKHTPRKRGTMQPFVGATLQVLEDRILIDRWLPKRDLQTLQRSREEPVYLDVQSVRNPATGGRNVRYRVAASPGWKGAFTLKFDNTLVSAAEMESIIRDAGKFAGLGDGRTIGFGRFELRSIKTVTHSDGANAQKQTTTKHLERNSKKGVGARRTKVPSVPHSGSAE